MAARVVSIEFACWDYNDPPALACPSGGWSVGRVVARRRRCDVWGPSGVFITILDKYSYMRIGKVGRPCRIKRWITRLKPSVLAVNDRLKKIRRGYFKVIANFWPLATAGGWC